MARDRSNSSNLEQLALNGLSHLTRVFLAYFEAISECGYPSPAPTPPFIYQCQNFETTAVSIQKHKQQMALIAFGLFMFYLPVILWTYGVRFGADLMLAAVAYIVSHFCSIHNAGLS